MKSPANIKSTLIVLSIALTLIGRQIPAMAGDNVPKSFRWTNSLGMIFVPVSNTAVRFSIFETRVKDFSTFAASAPKLDGAWSNALYHGVTPVSVGPEYPVVNVSWNDAKAFCAWLTEKERAAKIIATNSTYRLPTDEEWSCAAGIGGKESGDTPKAKNQKLADVYPWGSQYPPPPGAGNFADQTTLKFFTNFPNIAGYDDGYVTTAPVGSFKANEAGIYDLAGNAMEWCEDFYDDAHKHRALRGGAWINIGPGSLLSSAREHASPNRCSVATGFRCVLVTNP